MSESTQPLDIPELDLLAARNACVTAKYALSQARNTHTEAVLQALRAGIPIAQISRDAGVSRQHIYDIKQNNWV